MSVASNQQRWDDDDSDVGSLGPFVVLGILVMAIGMTAIAVGLW